MERVNSFSTNNTSSLKGRKIDWIVVHYTAGTSSAKGKAKSTAKYFAKVETKASADFIVDDETIVQFNEDMENRYTWHCGGSKYKTKGGSQYKICTNKNSIGIEVCSTNKTKKVTTANDNNWFFTDAVVDNLVVLVKELKEKFGIDDDHVIRHYDVNGKPCPGIVGWNEDTDDVSQWESFKERIKKVEVKAEETKKVEEPEEDYLFEIETVIEEEVKKEVENKPAKKETKNPKIDVEPVKIGLLTRIVNFLREFFN